MPCGCNPCDAKTVFGCSYCCGEEHECLGTDPITGRCIALGDPCLAPCAGEGASAAGLDITFPSAGSLAGSGSVGSWIRPQEGPQFWANLNGHNTSPDPEAIEVPFSYDEGGEPPTAHDVAVSFLAALLADGTWFAYETSDATLRLTCNTAGLRLPASQSGEFTFANEFDGADPSEERCQLPQIDLLPFDGFTAFVDANEDGFDDLEQCLGDCDDTRADAVQACDDAYPLCLTEGQAGCLDYCTCIKDAEIASVECRSGCHVASVPGLLAKLQGTFNARTDCCRGDHSACVAPCDQTFFDAVKDSEAGWFTALGEGEVAYYATACSGGDFTATGGSYRIPLPAWWTAYQRNCLYPAREEVMREPRRVRARCRATCERDEMIRRNRCDAWQHECDGHCQAEYDAALSVCFAAYYTCNCADPGADCLTPLLECLGPALTTGRQCSLDCCIAANPVAPHGHALDLCLRDAWVAYAAALTACCVSIDECVRACSGDAAGQAGCISTCLTGGEACRAAAAATFTAAVHLCHGTLEGDCPACFDPALPLELPSDPCTVSNFYETVCTSLVLEEEDPLFGLCANGTSCLDSFGQPCGPLFDLPCDRTCQGGLGTEADCCSAEGECAIETSVTCFDHTCTITRDPDDSCRELTNTCPDSLLDFRTGPASCLPLWEAD